MHFDDIYRSAITPSKRRDKTRMMQNQETIEFVRLSNNNLKYALACTLIFFLVHGLALTSHAYNVDDWLNHNGIVWLHREGRWLAYLLYEFVSDGSATVPLSATLAALCYGFAIHLALPRNCSIVFKTVLFSYLITHPYFVDILNFDIIVFGYGLATLLSFLASYLIARIIVQTNPTTAKSLGGCFLVATLLYLTISINQLFIIAWGMAFAASYVKLMFDDADLSVKISFVISAVFCAGLALMFYWASSVFLFEAIGVEQESRLSRGLTFSDFPARFAQSIYDFGNHVAANQLHVGRWLQILYIILFLLTCLGFAARSIEGRGSSKLDLLSPIVVLAFCFLPSLLLNSLLASDLPFRVFFLTNFCVIILGFYSFCYFQQAHSGVMSQRLCWLWKTGLILAVFFGFQTCSSLWDLQREAHRQNVAMAGALYQEFLKFAATNDLPRDRILLIGNAPPHFGNGRFMSVGRSAFHGAPAVIMEALYPVEAEHRPNEEGGVQDCAAFPAVDAWTIEEGMAAVCLG